MTNNVALLTFTPVGILLDIPDLVVWPQRQEVVVHVDIVKAGDELLRELSRRLAAQGSMKA